MVSDITDDVSSHFPFINTVIIQVDCTTQVTGIEIDSCLGFQLNNSIYLFFYSFFFLYELLT